MTISIAGHSYYSLHMSAFKIRITYDYINRWTQLLLQSQLWIRFPQKSCHHASYRNGIKYLEKFSHVREKCGVSMLPNMAVIEYESQSNIHLISLPWKCAKSVQILSYFWSVFSYIRTEYGKIRTRNNSVFGHFSRSVEVC